MSTGSAINLPPTSPGVLRRLDMRTAFDFRRTGIFWWAVLSALVYLIPAAWLAAAADFIRRADWLKDDRPPLSVIVDLRKAIDTFAANFTSAIQFNAAENLVVVGPVRIPNVVIAIIVAVLLMAVALVFYRRATSSPGLLDDLIAMIVIYTVLRIEGAATANVPVVGAIDKAAPNSYLIIMVLFMLYQLVRGRGASDSAVFFKVLFEALIIAILIVPTIALQAVAFVIEFPTKIHEFLAHTQYFAPIAAGWAILGIVLGISNIYNSGRGASPRGGGGRRASAPPGGGGA